MCPWPRWGTPVDLVTADLSFISVTRAIPVLVGEVALPGAPVVILVKPQFEAGRAEASRGKGVIRDPEVHRRTLARCRARSTPPEQSSWGSCPHRSPVPPATSSSSSTPGRRGPASGRWRRGRPELRAWWTRPWPKPTAHGPEVGQPWPWSPSTPIPTAPRPAPGRPGRRMAGRPGPPVDLRPPGRRLGVDRRRRSAGQPGR